MLLNPLVFRAGILRYASGVLPTNVGLPYSLGHVLLVGHYISVQKDF